MYRNAEPWLVVLTFAPRAILGALLLSIGDVVFAVPAPAPADSGGPEVAALCRAGSAGRYRRPAY